MAWRVLDLPDGFYRVAWKVLFYAALALELIALQDEDKGETATSILRPLIQNNTITKILFFAAIGWLIWHFIIEKGRVK